MDPALSDLENKISQLVGVVHHLRAENRSLRQQLVSKTDESKRLAEKIEAAKVRLDSLLKQLPETTP
jgi:cell division protein ZapB